MVESYMYCVWGCDVIGMINMFEVKFVCEVELCYVLIVMIIDYDSWYFDYGVVQIIDIIVIFQGNFNKVWEMVVGLFV